MIDRIVHHANVIALKGASYRIRHTAIDKLPPWKPIVRQIQPRNLLTFQPKQAAQDSTGA